MRFALLIPLLFSGCLLDTEICGEDFVETGGRCVPRAEPPPFRGSASASPGGRDIGVRRDSGQGRDAGLPDGSEQASAWAPYDLVVVVDRTNEGEVARTPLSPGTDLDAVQVTAGDAEYYGVELGEAFLVPGSNRSDDPSAALLPPEFDDSPQFFVSLGGRGGYVAIRTGLPRPFQRGDELTVYTLEFDGARDRYDVYLCAGLPIDPGSCIILVEDTGAPQFSSTAP